MIRLYRYKLFTKLYTSVCLVIKYFSKLYAVFNKLQKYTLKENNSYLQNNEF